MRVLYDGQIYTISPTGGIARYFTSLIDRLPTDFTPVVTTSQNNNLYYPTHPNCKTFFYERFGFRPGRVSYWLEKYYFRAVEASQNFDIVHPTYYSLLTQQTVDCYRLPTVLTVYDMIHEIFFPNDKTVELKRKAIQTAQAIICISENTRRDLLERYQLLEEKVTVIHLASEVDVSLSYGDEPTPTLPYYLYVGHRGTYKNFDTLLKAFAKVASVRSEIALCTVGSALSQDEQIQIIELGVEDRIINYSYITDRHLAKLYRCSIALVYPSHYEGFGIPLLEAMACSTAVIASNSSSIPEVVGEAGFLFDSSSTNDLADILLFLLENPTERERLITKGKERANIFNWDKTVTQTLNVYQSVVS